jgi:hypothetical protein
MKEIVLSYIGAGASISGWPARDLTAQDVERIKKEGVSIETLIQSGLYEYASKKEVKK